MSATNPWPNRTGVYASPTLFLLPKVALFRIWATIGRGRSSALEHSPPQLSCERARERHTKLGRNPQVSEGFRIDIINSELPNHQGTMVATATMVGAIMGLSCQLYSNGVRKLPLMRRKHLPSTLNRMYIRIHSFHVCFSQYIKPLWKFVAFCHYHLVGVHCCRGSAFLIIRV